MIIQNNKYQSNAECIHDKLWLWMYNIGTLKNILQFKIQRVWSEK